MTAPPSFASHDAEISALRDTRREEARVQQERITAGLVKCLREAGMQCKDCGGWGVIDPSSLPATPAEDWGPIEGCDVCADPACYRNEGVVMVTCPSCKGSRLAPEYEQKPGCPECSPGGELDTDWAFTNGSCTFGCGSKIDSDETGMCRNCKDHSANRAECEICGAVYEDWNQGKWERQ